MSQWDFSCRDWWAKLQRGETPIADLPIDWKEAQAAIDLFDALRLPDVPGTPAQRNAAGDWQRDIVAAIFGSLDKQTGIRRVGEVFVLVPKKNAKTTGAAGIALTYMLRNTRPNAELQILAPTQKIAETGFDQAAGMIEAGLDIPDVDPNWLKDRLHVREHLKKIECRKTGAELAVKTFDTKVVTGSKPVFVLVDETHELGTMHTAEKVFRQLRGGQDPFPEAVFVQITTQSDGRPTGIFKSELQYARAVRDGRIADQVRLLPVLYEFPEDVQTSDDQKWLNPDLWGLVNPNAGRSTSVEKLVAGHARASADGKAAIQSWATQHLNVEAGLALHSDRWVGADYWTGRGDSTLTLQALLQRSEVVTGGIDGGGLDDLAALSFLGREYDTRRWLHWTHVWAYDDVFERRQDIVSSLEGFIADGDLTRITQSGQHHKEMADLIMMVHDSGLMPEKEGLGIDPAQVAALLDELALAGLPEGVACNAPQTARYLSPVIWGIETKLKFGEFVHADQPVMAWAVGNAIAQQRGNAIMIDKQVAGKAKIDPLASLLDAGMMMQLNPVAAVGRSYMDQQKVVVL